MKKMILILALCAAFLASCNGEDKNVTDGSTQSTAESSAVTTEKKEINMTALAADAVKEIKFSVTLEELSSDAVVYLYPGLPEDTEAVVYSTGGAGAEELAVFRTSDVTSLLSVLDNHKTEQRNLYASYKPEDVEKIDNAVTFQQDEYVVFCISEDHSAAKTVIEGLFK